MSDNDLPDIPSFEDLGLTPEEIAELEKDMDDPGPEDPDVEKLAGPKKGAPQKATPDGGREPESRQADAPVEDRASKKADAKREKEAKKADAKKEKKAKKAAAKAPKEPTAPPSPAPMGGLRGPLSLLLLVVFAWLSGANRALPSPVPESAPDSVFASGRAMEHVRAIASTAHPPGSPAHDEARAYLMTELRRLGLEPTVQTTTAIIGRGTFVRATTVRNVVARVPGTASGPAVLVTSHYDGREIAKGAGDDASGVASILETLRVLRTGEPLANDLIVLLTDAEELGLMGARAFVAEHPWMDDVGLVISIEMRGGGGPSIMFETGANSGWVVEQYQQADPYPVATSLAFEIYKRMPNDTDFTPFKEAGKQGLNFAGIGRAPVYHQTYDSPENLSEATVQHHGSHALAVLRHFGNADLSQVEGPDPVYVSVPVLGLVVYPAWWVWVLGIAGLVLWLVAVAVVRSRGGGWGGMAAGLFGGLATVALPAAAGHFLFQLRAPAHPELGALHGSAFHSEGWYVLALVFGGFLIGSLVFGVLRRWFSLGELGVGSLLLPLIGVVAATVAVPLGAMTLQWPFLGAIAGALATAWMTREGHLGTVTWLVLLVAAVPVAALWAPLVELLWLSMSLRLGAVLGGLVGVSAILVMPLLEVMRREPNRWWFSLASVVAVAACLAIAVRNATPSADRPAPSTLLYLVDRDAGSATWGTDGTRSADAPGVVWASAQVGSFGEPVEWGVGPLARPYRLAEASGPEEADQRPMASIVDDSTAAPERVRLAIRSALGAEMMRFAFGQEGPYLMAVNGKERPGPEAPNVVEHWGTPEGAVVLEFQRSSAGESFEFEMEEHLLRPQELVGSDPFRRPPDLAPDINRGSDRAILRGTVRVDLTTGAVTIGGESAAADSTGLMIPGVGDLPGAVPDSSAVADSLEAVGQVTERQPGADAADTASAAPDTSGVRRDTIRRR